MVCFFAFLHVVCYKVNVPIPDFQSLWIRDFWRWFNKNLAVKGFPI
jgi:hypothetical protein